ncbi:MAG: hypothetical protein DHS20C16_04210 [Phycisphaerae bacterium]|nr:MAG: hypothetical protein DHS20C16_04210 [Phycisphaerae bacterium]
MVSCCDFRVIVVLATLGMICPSFAKSPDEPQTAATTEANLLKEVGENFKIKTTAHFVIVYDGDTETIADFIARIEATYRGVYRFLKLHDLDSTVPAQKLEMLFFEHPDSFFEYAERTGASVTGAAGFYSPKTNRSAFYHALNMRRLVGVNEEIASIEASLDSRQRSNRGRDRKNVLKQLRRLRIERDQTIESVNQLVVQHEVAHQVLYNAGLHSREGDHPTWLVEGLACLFETPPNRNGAGFATVNQYRLLNLREALTGEIAPKRVRAASFKDAIRHGRLVPLRRLIGDGSLFDTGKPNVGNAYAQAWSLVHYLHRRKREAFGDYLMVLAKRPTDRAYSAATELMIFEEVFGPVDDNFVKGWLDYCLDLRVR